MASETSITPAAPTPSPTQGEPPAPLAPAPDKAGPVLVALLLLLSAATAVVPIHNSDFLQHLALGRWLASGHLPLGTDPLNFPNEVVTSAHPTWLFDLALYLLFLVGGAVLIVVVKTALTVLIVEQWRRGATLPDTPTAPLVLCWLLGLVVLAPYLLVQSRFASLVLLSTTVYLLGRYRTDKVPPVWALPVLCLAWANLDNWFFLGPLCIALYYAGARIEESQRADAPKQSEKLLVPLLASVVAMCLTPGLLVLRFDLPPELGLNANVAAVADLPGFTHLVATPLSGDYFQPTTGWSVAGQAYFLLLLLTLVSFPLLGQRLAWSGLLVVVALAVLSLYRVVAIPFFAVAGTYWLARNIQELFALQAAGDPSKRDPSAGVLLAVLLLLVVGVATVPGWLHPWPWSKARLGLGLEPEADLREMAEGADQIAAWYTEKTAKTGRADKTPPNWLNTSPAVAHYLAWYAPEQRSYLDQRLLVSAAAAADYRAAFQALFLTRADLEKPGLGSRSDLPERYQVFRQRGVRFLACQQPDLAQLMTRRVPPQTAPEELPRYRPVIEPLFALGLYLGDWPILQLRGATSVLAFRDPQDRSLAGFFNDRLLRVRAQAYAEQHPLDSLPVPTQEAEPRPWVATLWSPEPPPPLDAAEAIQFDLLYRSNQPLLQMGNRQEWEKFRAVATQGYALALGTGVPWPGGATSAALQYRLLSAENEWRVAIPPASLFFADKDVGSPAALTLMLRAARRAIAENPLAAQGHYRLALAYMRLARETREQLRSRGFGQLYQLRRFQIIAAAQAAVRLDPDLLPAHFILANVYDELGYRDLYLEHQTHVLRLDVAAGPAPGESADDAQKRWKGGDEHLQQVKKEIENRKARLDLQTTKLKPVQKAAVALQPAQRNGPGFGLAEVASKLLRSLKVEDLSERFEDGDSPGPRLLAETMFLRGEMTDARRFVVQRTETDAFGFHTGVMLPAHDWYQLCLLACLGDYVAVDATLVALLEKTQQAAIYAAGRKACANLTARFLGNMAGQLHVPPPLAAFKFSVVPENLSIAGDAAGQILEGQGIEGMLHTLRGCLALEPGDLALAQAEFDAALEIMRKAEVGFPAIPMAYLGLELLKRGQEVAKAQ